MEAIRQIVTVPATREIHIQLPDTAAIHEEVEIIVLFKSAPKSLAEKISLLQEAVNDQLFLDDLKEIAEDFKYIDQEEHL